MPDMQMDPICKALNKVRNAVHMQLLGVENLAEHAIFQAPHYKLVRGVGKFSGSLNVFLCARATHMLANDFGFETPTLHSRDNFSNFIPICALSHHPLPITLLITLPITL